MNDIVNYHLSEQRWFQQSYISYFFSWGIIIQFFRQMDDLKDLECPICLSLCQDAVESHCCGHAFCSGCAVNFARIKMQCPFCRKKPFNFSQSRVLRRMIAQIKVPCPYENCPKKISNCELADHTKNCNFRTIQCRLCKNPYLIAQISSHTNEKHKEQFQKIILQFHTNEIEQAIQCENQIRFGLLKLDFNYAVTNLKGRNARLGQSQKYYCGGDLGFKCKCCEDKCGPYSKENCVACMDLDIKMRKLPKGFLVNAGGKICKVQSGRVTCSTVQMYPKSLVCTLEQPCSHCANLTFSLPRYQSLLL